MKAKLLVLILSLVPVLAYADSSCSRDAKGDINCTYDDGSRSTTWRDAAGRDQTIITDRDGNTRTMSCSTDAIGRYNCR